MWMSSKITSTTFHPANDIPMNFSVTRIFFPRWYLLFVAGGVIGMVFSFLGHSWAFGVGAVLLWFSVWFWVRMSSRRKVVSIQRIVSDVPENSSLCEIFASAEKCVTPAETLIKNMAEKIISFETEIKPSKSKSDFSGKQIDENLESLAQEQEKTVQFFSAFKNAIQDWSSNIEKAGRINKSLLQLNELIVSDSKKVAQDTDSAAKSATDGIKSVGKEIKAMTEIKATIGSSAEVIQQLNLASEQIGEFLATITSIARKTNLLALNAGIEAARAGEHGQGFAVVASEIKTLAEASAKAAGDVKHLVDDIRMKTTNAISLISTTGKIEENVNVVYSAGDVFMNIVKSIRKAGGLLGEISQALDDQRNDNELLVQLLHKIYLSGDQVKEKFELTQQSLGQVRKISQKIKADMGEISPGVNPGTFD
jgi:methyl-accepting chemotaxis protein